MCVESVSSDSHIMARLPITCNKQQYSDTPVAKCNPFRRMHDLTRENMAVESIQDTHHGVAGNHVQQSGSKVIV